MVSQTPRRVPGFRDKGLSVGLTPPVLWCAGDSAAVLLATFWISIIYNQCRGKEYEIRHPLPLAFC